MVGYRFTNLYFQFGKTSVVCAKTTRPSARAPWLFSTNPAQRKLQTPYSIFCAVSRHTLLADLTQPRMTARSLHGHIVRITAISGRTMEPHEVNVRNILSCRCSLDVSRKLWQQPRQTRDLEVVRNSDGAANSALRCGLA